MVAEAEDRVRDPVEARDALLVEPHLLVERARDALHRGSGHLVLDELEADRQAGVECVVDVLHDDRAGLLVELDLDHGGGHPCAPMAPEAEAAAVDDVTRLLDGARDPRLPAGGLRRGVHDAEPPLVADVLATERDRVDPRRVGELVDQLLRRE